MDDAETEIVLKNLLALSSCLKVKSIMALYIACRRQARSLRRLNDHVTAGYFMAKADAYFRSAKLVKE
jgi:hypothetical protein